MGHRDITAVLSVETLPNVRHGSKLAILLGLIFLSVVAHFMRAPTKFLETFSISLPLCSWLTI